MYLWKSSPIFGKMFRMFVWPSDNFWRIFGLLLTCLLCSVVRISSSSLEEKFSVYMHPCITFTCILYRIDNIFSLLSGHYIECKIFPSLLKDYCFPSLKKYGKCTCFFVFWPPFVLFCCFLVDFAIWVVAASGSDSYTKLSYVGY